MVALSHLYRVSMHDMRYWKLQRLAGDGFASCLGGVNIVLCVIGIRALKP
jgi:hypothetical protein